MKTKINILSEIYFIGDEETFCVGDIVFYNNKMLISRNVDPYGNYDGFRMNKIKYISKISYNTKYINFLKKIRIVAEDRHIFDSIEHIFDTAIRNNKLLSVTLKGWKTIKNIKLISIENGNVAAQLLNRYGEFYKNIYFHIDEVEILEFDTIELRTYERFLNSVDNNSR